MSRHSNRPTPDEPIEILLAEDNPGDVRLVEEALKAVDHEITLRTATSGDDAVEALLRPDGDGSYPDIVLLDLNLPGRDGCEVLRAIREDGDARRLPVLMLTSSDSEEDVVRCYEAGTNAYLTKPTDPGEFSAMIETLERFWFEKVRLPAVSA